MNIGLPAGIGDFSWAWSKLCHLKDRIDSIQVCDGWPHRTVPYIELCFENADKSPKVGYGDFNYITIQLFTKSNGIENPTLEKLLSMKDYGRILLEPNQHLELGRRLEDWIPDLPCNFHYPLYTSFANHSAMMKLLKALEEKQVPHDAQIVGISCASYRGSEAWKTWGREEWKDCLQRLIKRGWYPLILGGFWDDLSYTLACELNLPDLVGKTNIAECVEIFRILPAYVGFSSGLNVIRTVLNKPAFALWPDHQVELATSWVPPQMLEDRRYSWALWRPVEDVFPQISQFLKLCE